MKDNLIIILGGMFIVLAITIPLKISSENNHLKNGDIKIDGRWYPKELIKECK